MHVSVYIYAHLFLIYFQVSAWLCCVRSSFKSNNLPGSVTFKPRNIAMDFVRFYISSFAPARRPVCVCVCVCVFACACVSCDITRVCVYVCVDTCTCVCKHIRTHTCI